MTPRRRLLLVVGMAVLAALVAGAALALRQPPAAGRASAPPSAAPSAAASPTSPATATASPSPAPTASAGPRLDCARAPSTCGYPDASTTGVRPGTALVKVPQQATRGKGWAWDPRGWILVTGPNSVLQGLDVAGSIDVGVSGVTIRDTRVRQTGERFGIALRHTRGVTIEDCEVSGPDAGRGRLGVGITDLNGDSQGTRVLRTEVFHTATAIQLYQGLVQDSYVHDLGLVAGDHVNGVMDNGGTRGTLAVRHNTVLNPNPQTDAVALFQDFGGQADCTIEDNLLAGGAYTVYGGEGKAPTARIRITGNRFARVYFPDGGRYGPVTGFQPHGTGNVWEDNVWDDTGQAVAGG